MDEELDLQSLENALARLKENAALVKDTDHPLFETIREGTIQTFEFNYDLGIKFIRRGLELIQPATIADRLDFRDVLRVAAESGLIKDPQRWFEYRKERNITSHTYDEEKADEVLQYADSLVEDVEFLLEKLRNIHVLPE